MASITPEESRAIADTANRLGVDPYSLGALINLETATTWNPNKWGGAGDNYRGLIQFGPGARKETGLPDRPMTIIEQLPYVEKYFQQRGFKPGEHGVTQLYRTVLVGNPYQSGTDSFGTNSDKAATEMMPGGAHYKAAQRVMGDVYALPKKVVSKAQPAPQEKAKMSILGIEQVPVRSVFQDQKQQKRVDTPEVVNESKTASSEGEKSERQKMDEAMTARLNEIIEKFALEVIKQQSSSEDSTADINKDFDRVEQEYAQQQTQAKLEKMLEKQKLDINSLKQMIAEIASEKEEKADDPYESGLKLAQEAMNTPIQLVTQDAPYVPMI